MGAGWLGGQSQHRSSCLGTPVTLAGLAVVRIGEYPLLGNNPATLAYWHIYKRPLCWWLESGTVVAQYSVTILTIR